MRAGLELNYTQGFNPKPKLEFANPITLGFESVDEIASIEMFIDDEINNQEAGETFINRMNKSLPEGIMIRASKVINPIASKETGKKVKSLMASYNGGLYEIEYADEQVSKNLVNLLSQMNGVVIEKFDMTLTVKTFRDENGKIMNIFKMMKETAGYEFPFDHISVKRVKTFCALSDKERHIEADYFSLYK